MIKIKENAVNTISLQDVINAVQYFSMHNKNIKCKLANEFLSHLPKDEYIVDSRVSMLKKGWFPCIPGWHFDEIMRHENGNLDIISTDFNKTHYMMVIDIGTNSLTEFCAYRFTKDFLLTHNIDNYDSFNMTIYMMESPIKTCKSNTIYQFSSLDAHRGVDCKDSGWRYFIRATANHQREYLNQIRTQTQVYIPFYNINKGW